MVRHCVKRRSVDKIVTLFMNRSSLNLEHSFPVSYRRKNFWAVQSVLGYGQKWNFRFQWASVFRPVKPYVWLQEESVSCLTQETRTRVAILLWLNLVVRRILWGCVHIDRSTSPSRRIRVPRNTSLHVFQRRPFTLIRVLYEYRLSANFTRTSSFCTVRVFIQPVRSKQHKICINLTYRLWYRPQRMFDVIDLSCHC